MSANSTALHIIVPPPIEEAPGYFEYSPQTSKDGQDPSFLTFTRDGNRYLDSPTSSDLSSPMMTPLSFKVMIDHQQEHDSKRIGECEPSKAAKIDLPFQTIENHPFMSLKPQPPQQKNEKSQEYVLKSTPTAIAPASTKPTVIVQSYSTKYANFVKSSSSGPTIVHVSPKSSTLSSSVTENVVTSRPSTRNGVNDGVKDSSRPSTHVVLSMIENEKVGLHQAGEDASVARHVNTNQQQHYFQQQHHHHQHRDSLGGQAPPPPYLQSDHGVAESSSPPPHASSGFGLGIPSSSSSGVRGDASSRRNLKRQSMPHSSSLHSLASSGLSPSVTTLVAPPPLSNTSVSSTPSFKTPKEMKRHSLPVSMIKRPALAALLPSVGTSEVQWPSAMTMSMGIVGSVVTRPQLARTMTPPPQATTLFTPRSAITAATNVGNAGDVGSGRLLERSEMERSSSEMYEDDDEKRDEDFHPLSPLTSQRPCKADHQLKKGLTGGRGRGRVGGSITSLGGFQHQAHGSGSTEPSTVVVGALTRSNLHHMNITGYQKSVATNRDMMDASNMKARENFPGFFEDAKELGSHWMFYSYGVVLVGALIWALMVPLLAPWAAVLPGAVAMIWMAQYASYRWRRRQNNKQLVRDRQQSAVAKHAHAAAAAVLRPNHLHHSHTPSSSSSVRPNHSQQSSVSENDRSVSSILSSPTAASPNHSHHRQQQYLHYNSPPHILKSQFQHQYQSHFHRQSSSSSSSSPSVSAGSAGGSPLAGWSANMASASPAQSKFSPPLPAFPEGESEGEQTSPSNVGSSTPPRTSFPSGTLQSDV
ncbi:hypothetical protein EMPS_07905 [Entomortierella parvispora]|uniref:Uncharacterized protein n=1 Tax=Entomortierella parvispora TaxID=205924 RepID=A0A9P3LYW1_9FUNG|nr:hypothetical protein EMPS_07905 [Entomortierella parvispora]